MSLAARELRETRLQLVRTNRRVALAHVEGPVAERDEKKWKVRLELGTDPATGEKVLSPWLKPHSNSAGAYKQSPALPAIGDRMRMMSPSGIVGGASYALPGPFDDEVKRPDGQEKDETATQMGETRISLKKDAYGVTSTTIRVESEETRVVGKKVTKIEAPSIDKLKIVLGGTVYHLRPEAIEPSAQGEGA